MRKTTSYTTTQIIAKEGWNPSVLAFVVFLIFAIAIYKMHSDWMILVVVLFAIAVFVFYFLKSLSFANLNPQLALLERAELVAYKKIELAAKGMSSPPNDDLISNPKPGDSLLIDEINGGEDE